MHLFKKWSKYAFAYASMQMHNYPKHNYKITKLTFKSGIEHCKFKITLNILENQDQQGRFL